MVKKFIDYIDNGTYPGGVLLIHGMTFKQIKKSLKKTGDMEWFNPIDYEKQYINTSKFCAMFRRRDGKDYYYIYIKNFEFTDMDMCALAHEVLHICQFFIRDLCDVPENEMEAYYHTHIMKRSLELLRKHSIDWEGPKG